MRTTDSPNGPCRDNNNAEKTPTRTGNVSHSVGTGSWWRTVRASRKVPGTGSRFATGVTAAVKESKTCHYVRTRRDDGVQNKINRGAYNSTYLTPEDHNCHMMMMTIIIIIIRGRRRRSSSDVFAYDLRSVFVIRPAEPP